MTDEAKEGTNRTHPMLGIFAVLLGASLATFLGRLLSVGAGDLRGALGLDFDGGAWIGTAYNMGLMFFGPFSVYLGGLLGARRVLLACAVCFCAFCCMLPFCSSLDVMLGLLFAAGLAAGSFYPLTLSFVLRNLPPRYLVFGIGAYAADIVVTTHLAHFYESWLIRSFSWTGIFWTEACATPVMAMLVFFGIAPQPLPQPKPGQQKPSWRGFLYASLGAMLLYAALDQGQRLDWWRSGTFVGLVVAAAFLIGAAAIRHFTQPNPLVNFHFLAEGNTLLLALVLLFFRFVLLATVVVVPSYLSSIQGYTAEQTGPVLLWIAVPQLLTGALAIALLSRLDSRLILAIGFVVVAAGCIVNADLTAAWAGTEFTQSQMLLSLGEAFAFNGLVGTIVLELMNSGALSRGVDVLTFAGFFQTVRLLGGEAGASFIQFFLQRREQFHSNALGTYVQRGALATSERAAQLGAAMMPHAATTDTGFGRAAIVLAGSVRRQAFTLAVGDAFRLIACAAIACLVVIASMSTLKLQYREVTSAAPQDGTR